jgi:hypothetical protein
MASTDARPVPRKNVAYRVTFPILDADGDLVTGAAGLDSEISLDAGAFADCTNEATEIATSSGVYYLDLTSGEMNADCVAIIVKTSTSGAKTTTIVMYPEEAGDYRADTTHFGGTAGTFSGGRPEVNTTHAAGTAWGSGAITAGSIAADAITAAKIADGAIDAATFAAGAITATSIAADAITAAKVADGTIDAATFAAGAITASAIAADAITAAKIADGAIDAATFAAGAINASAIAADAITAAKVADGTIDAATFAAGAIDAAAIAANAIGSSELADTAAVKVADALLDRDMSTGADSGSTTVRTVRQALRFLRNKWSISGTTLTVTKEDDSTSSWTSTVSTDAAAVPVVGNDPAGP